MQRDISTGVVQPIRRRIIGYDPVDLPGGPVRLVVHAALDGLEWELYDDTDCVARWAMTWGNLEAMKYRVGGRLGA